MFCTYQDRDKLEDDLYHDDDEGDSEGSEANSELEFHLYSQLHYSSNAGEMGELEDRGEETEGQNNQLLEVTETPLDSHGKLDPNGDSEPSSFKMRSLQQHAKNRKSVEKCNGHRKRKSDSKEQKLSSSLFEEVIVIDSSPDVISISEDDTADEEGVCTLKGKGLHQLQTSTPAQQVIKGNQKRSLTMPVTVDLSSSESDSEESESKSDSDYSESSDSDSGLENWMILGRGQQDGDLSISLNLEGGCDSSAEEEDGSWLVSDKDKEAQICNKDRSAGKTVQRLSNRYYTAKNIQCRNCSKTGHLSKNCPEPKKLVSCFLCGTPGHVVTECPNKHCNNCGLPGHQFNSCSEKAYWHKQCHRCSMRGHFFDACPEIWRQYHITTKKGPPVKQQGEDISGSPAYCYNCSRKGHFGHVCARQKMFNGVYLNTPFINHYDSVEDINRRQHRIKLKVKEMKKNGFFHTTSQTPLTSGPPKKKQKIHHHKDNQQPNHTPHQTPKKHKPSPNHIFFPDSDFKKATSKMNKHNRFTQQESTGKVKPWKPKRPVPTSREVPPQNRLLLDEAEDFPRGGGKAENAEKKKKKNTKGNKIKKEMPPKRHRDTRQGWTVTGEMQGSETKRNNGKKKRRRNRAQKAGDRKLVDSGFPADENLFIIKQRKRSR